MEQVLKHHVGGEGECCDNGGDADTGGGSDGDGGRAVTLDELVIIQSDAPPTGSSACILICPWRPRRIRALPGLSPQDYPRSDNLIRVCLFCVLCVYVRTPVTNTALRHSSWQIQGVPHVRRGGSLSRGPLAQRLAQGAVGGGGEHGVGVGVGMRGFGTPWGWAAY